MRNSFADSIGKPLRFRHVVNVCIVVSAFCFLEYLLSVVTYAGTVFSYALPIAAVCVILVPPLTERFWERCLPKKLFAAARGVYCFGVIFFCVTFGIFLAFLSSYENTAVQNEGPTAVLVYGCRVEGTEPKEMLAERLDAALALLYENETYERIAGKTYMSVRTVKNHAKKLYELAGCSKKEEFVALLRSTWKKVQDSVQILPKKRTCGDGQNIV